MKTAILIVACAFVCSARSDCISVKAMAEITDKAIQIVDQEGPASVQWEPVHRDRIFTISTGEIFGLKNMRRIAPPEIQCLDDRLASVKIAVEMTDVKIVYPWKLGGRLKFSGKVYGHTKFIRANVHFTRSADENEPLVFNKFDITEVGKVTSRVTGASYVTWITSYFVTRISNTLRNTVGDALEKQVGHTICDVLNKVDGIRKIVDNTQ